MSGNAKPYNLEPNVEAALAYLVTPVTGIIILITEKENEFVRFHALQSVLFGFAAFGAALIADALMIVLIGFLLKPAVFIASIILWLFLMWKAYNNETYELPVLGKIARDRASK